ncbi:hypothetical protein V1264_015325 [Littorina saxatilis]|uniref:Uncharacterized protein n=1 Tax=Littorina saxatilis TaxID=31220 RepID=A0AAN9GGC6_9CAEN
MKKNHTKTHTPLHICTTSTSEGLQTRRFTFLLSEGTCLADTRSMERSFQRNADFWKPCEPSTKTLWSYRQDKLRNFASVQICLAEHSLKTVLTVRITNICSASRDPLFSGLVTRGNPSMNFYNIFPASSVYRSQVRTVLGALIKTKDP